MPRTSSGGPPQKKAKGEGRHEDAMAEAGDGMDEEAGDNPAASSSSRREGKGASASAGSARGGRGGRGRGLKGRGHDSEPPPANVLPSFRYNAGILAHCLMCKRSNREHGPHIYH